jgi:hypothetical protein
MGNEIEAGEVILEFVRIGGLSRVSAMEPKSPTEVVIYRPASAGGRPCATPCCASSTTSSGVTAPIASWPAISRER